MTTAIEVQWRLDEARQRWIGNYTMLLDAYINPMIDRLFIEIFSLILRESISESCGVLGP